MFQKISDIKFPFLYLFIFFFLFNCKETGNNSAKTSSIPLSTFVNSNNTSGFVSAHRGGSGIENYPENCLETMQFLYDKDIKIFEIDLSVTKDNQLILMHDNSLQRTSTGRQDVNQVNLETIKKYYLADDFGTITNYRIPTFAEALSWAKDKDLYLMVDMKKSVKYEDVIGLIRKNNIEDQTILISYTTSQAQKLHRLAPEIMLSVSMRNEKEYNEMMKSGIPTNKMVAFTGTTLSSSKLYELIHKENIMVILGTLGNLDNRAAARGDHLYREWADLGVDIFATDRPLAVLNALQ